jgi:hypothetical protein
MAILTRSKDRAKETVTAKFQITETENSSALHQFAITHTRGSVTAGMNQTIDIKRQKNLSNKIYLFVLFVLV